MKILGFLPGQVIPGFDSALLAAHGADEHLCMEDGSARCSVWWTEAPPAENEKLGVIGHFQTASAGAGRQIVAHAFSRLQEHGCTLAVGPMDGNTWRRYRVLTERGEEPPFFMEPDNPDSWQIAFKEAGFAPLAVYSSSLVDDLARRDPRLDRTRARFEREGVQIRCLNLSRFEEDLKKIYQVSVVSFTGNYLYTPISETAFLALSLPYREKIRPELVLIAEHEGRAAGYLFAIPDYAEAMRGSPIRTVIGKTLAVLPGRRYGGLGLVLTNFLHERALALGYTRVIHALQHEGNDRVRNMSEYFGKVMRRYTFVFPAAGMSTIPEILHENAARWPNLPALIATRRGRDVKLTFSELEAAAEAFAGRLVAKGIRRGDPVLVFVPMSIGLYVAMLGLFRIGATAVFLDPSSGLGHINACCKKLPPAGLISVWPLRWLRPFVRGLGRIPRVFPPPGPHWDSPANLPDLPSPDDAALITFTSGSTGMPKAAVRSHRFLIAQHEALKNSISLEPGERDLTTLPVFVLANLASGVTSILPDAKISHPGSVDAGRIALQLRRLGATRTGGSPAFYQKLASEQDALTGFQKIYTGGAPVFPALLRKLQSLAPTGRVVAVYGSTEAEPIAHVACEEISPEDWQVMREGGGLLAGIPISEIRLRVIPDQWGKPVKNLDPVAVGDPGEILVTGEHVLKGYLHGQGDEETKVAIEGDIWHRTGDAGYQDKHGRLWLLGRCSARVRDERGTLYPFAVECVAMSFSFVRRAAFVGLGGRRLLVVEGHAEISRENLGELQAQVGRGLVDAVQTLRRIPVDARHNAKVNYPKLLAMLGAAGKKS